jgi:outer membrane biogenesis lipoprotein LolB
MLRQEQRVDHFRFEWQHDSTHDRLRLIAPFGQSLAELHRDERGARLRHADGRLIQAPDLPSLTAQLFGRELPLDELPPWLRGEHPRLLGASHGWQIALESTERVISRDGSTHTLPRILSLTDGSTTLRLVIDTRTDTP